MKLPLFPASLVIRLCLLPVLLLLSACATVDPLTEAKLETRRLSIANEARGNWFIGRRYYIARTQFWGYLRRPGQPWSESRLVIFNEHQRTQPDRVPEEPVDGSQAHGFDHNYEYRIFGHFTGETVYDPNSNLFLPEFKLTGAELITPTPGFLFDPNERYTGDRLLRHEPGLN